jgi:hypothetical protein
MNDDRYVFDESDLDAEYEDYYWDSRRSVILDDE